CFRCLSCGPLRGGKDVDAGAILRADVVALAHALSWVVALPECLEQVIVGNLPGVEHDEDDLIMPGPAGAHFLVGRIGRGAARIAGCGDVDAAAELPELA